jgi:hypothetical protein
LIFILSVPIRKMSEDKKRIHKVLNYTKQ